MLNLPLVLLSIAVTFLSWGSYGTLLHEGQHSMHSSLRAFVGVGIAYFLVAVVPPVILISSKPEKGRWSLSGSLLSVLAGSVGALGALGIILAFRYGGKPIIVMPIVFGCAPAVNTLVTMALNRSYKKISPLFIVGLVLVLGGAVGAMVSKPKPPAPPAMSSETAPTTTTSSDDSQSGIVSGEHSRSKVHFVSMIDDESEDKENEANSSGEDEKQSNSNIALVVMSIFMAAICWGAYGPVLHIGQAKMQGSRFRPFICVGLAYFLIAVAAPLLFMTLTPEEGHWTWNGMAWSIGAGALGAVGALGIIYAFNFGGKPIYVMPLVFGFAPVVNTFIAIFKTGTLEQIGVPFIASLVTLIAGAVTTLVFAPRAAPKKPAAATKPDESATVGPASDEDTTTSDKSSDD